MRIPVSIHTVAYARKYYLQCYMKWNANNDSDLNDCVEYCTISTASIRSNSQSYGSLHLLHYPKSNTHTKNIRRAQNFRWIALCDATQPIATSQTNTTFNIPTTNKNNNSTRLAISILKVNLNTAWHTMHNNCCLNSIEANIVSKGEWEHLFIVIWQTNGIYGLLLHCVINPTIFTGLLPDFLFSNAMDLSVLNRFQLLFVTRKNTYNFRIITIESDKHTGWVTQKKTIKHTNSGFAVWFCFVCYSSAFFIRFYAQIFWYFHPKKREIILVLSLHWLQYTLLKSIPCSVLCCVCRMLGSMSMIRVYYKRCKFSVLSAAS